MQLVDFDLFKAHVRADDLDEDNAILSHYLAAAEAYVVKATHRDQAELLSMTDDGTLPKPLQQAIMMIAGHWYNQREDVTIGQMNQVPIGASTLISQFRKL